MWLTINYHKGYQNEKTSQLLFLTILPQWVILKKNLLKTVFQCHPCSQPAQRFAFAANSVYNNRVRNKSDS
jgi:hypothetical protein